jgi:hypothetical protein
LSNRYQPDYADRPGAVTAIHGIVFQSDGQSTVGRLFIRPVEALDRWIVGILPSRGEPTLAMHAGIHVTIDGSREYVVEQLVGSLYLDFKNGLNWTALEDFRKRDRGGWDETVPATQFRRLDQQAVDETAARLNAIEGHPFMGEDCTAFIERAFGGRRLFADSPLLRTMGIGARIGDPAGSTRRLLACSSSKTSKTCRTRWQTLNRPTHGSGRCASSRCWWSAR